MAGESITVHLVGDSTMAEKAASERPETGWGTPFTRLLSDSVRVENHARNGRSTRTFREEGRWAPVVDDLTDEDYVFVQFGHNDEVASKDQSTTEERFVANLESFVSDSRDHGATPVLLTSVARRRFGEEGEPVDTHRVYAALTREVARREDVALIDADERSRSLLSELGPEDSKGLYNHLAAGAHSNYPEGVADDTHFSEAGARRIAELVLEGIEASGLELAASIERGE